MSLTAKKLLVAAVLGFLAGFTPALGPVLDNLDELVRGEVEPSFLLALLAGAVGAGIAAVGRYAIGYFTTLMPTDAFMGSGKNPDAIVVTSGGEVTATDPPSNLPEDAEAGLPGQPTKIGP
jgi:hypothetical protein